MKNGNAHLNWIGHDLSVLEMQRYIWVEGGLF